MSTTLSAMLTEVSHKNLAALSALRSIGSCAFPKIREALDKVNNGELDLIVLYDDDLDGFTAHHAMEIAMPWACEYGPVAMENITRVPVNHGLHFKSVLEKHLEKDLSKTIVIVLDQGIYKSAYDALVKKAHLTVWVDHHAVNEEGCTDNYVPADNFIPLLSDDSTAMASYIIFPAIYNDREILGPYESYAVTDLVRAVDAYDTYSFFHLDSDEARDRAIALNMAFRYGQRDMIADVFYEVLSDHFSPDPYHELLDVVDKYVFVYKNVAESLAEHHLKKYTLEIDGVATLVGMIEGSFVLDQVATAAMEHHQDCAYILMHYTSKGYHRVSIRAPERDCTILAKMFGGGGRERTAGISMTHAQYLDFMSKLTPLD